MAEEEIVVFNERLTYEGIFSINELYKLIEGWLFDKGYDRRETSHTESVKPEGKFIDIKLEPWKTVSDYAKKKLKIQLWMSNVKDVVVPMDGKRVKMQQGKVIVVFDGSLLTDYRHRWEGKPIFVFMRSIYDKYIYKTFTGGFQKQITHDVEELKTLIKSFFNLYQRR